MGYRIGIDTADSHAVSASLLRFGHRYLQRVYTSQEVADCTWHGQVQALRLAARFAAKEAAVKVLRPGQEPIPWSAVAVHSRHDGSPELVLSGAAIRWATEQQLSDFEVSLTHEGHIASAVVLARTGGPADDV